MINMTNDYNCIYEDFLFRVIGTMWSCKEAKMSKQDLKTNYLQCQDTMEQLHALINERKEQL